MTAAATIPAQIAARFSNFQLKIFLGPPRISPLYKFIGMFDRLSTSFFFFFFFFLGGGGDLWFIVRVRERVRFRV